MYITTALAAGLATISAASAFLIPPEASIRGTEKEITSEIAHLFGLESTLKIELDCLGCAWGGIEEVDGKRVQWAAGYQTALVCTSTTVQEKY